MTQPSLAEQLQLLRKGAGLSASRLAAQLGWGEATARSKVSKIENARQLLSADEVRAWAQACGQPDAAADLLLMLADAQATYSSSRGLLRRGSAPGQEEYDRLVRAATLIRNSAPNVIPSFLQTAGYARAVLEQGVALWGISDIDAAVQARMHRQEVLYEPDREFRFVITEAALRLLPCPPAVMLGQLAFLQRFLSFGMESVTLGIIPLGIPVTVMPTTDFLLLDGQAITETHTGEVWAGELDSAKYAEIFAMLMADARTGDEAAWLISRAAGQLAQGE